MMDQFRDEIDRIEKRSRLELENWFHGSLLAFRAHAPVDCVLHLTSMIRQR